MWVDDRFLCYHVSSTVTEYASSIPGMPTARTIELLPAGFEPTTSGLPVEYHTTKVIRTLGCLMVLQWYVLRIVLFP